VVKVNKRASLLPNFKDVFGRPKVLFVMSSHIYIIYQNTCHSTIYTSDIPLDISQSSYIVYIMSIHPIFIGVNKKNVDGEKMLYIIFFADFLKKF
jgi:hypothetical protein